MYLYLFCVFTNTKTNINSEKKKYEEKSSKDQLEQIEEKYTQKEYVLINKTVCENQIKKVDKCLGWTSTLWMVMVESFTME